MQPSSRPEVIGLVLLGTSLLALAVTLRAAQPGWLEGPQYLWPIAALVLYAAIGVLVGGLTLRAVGAFALAVVVHLAYATLMGSTFTLLAGKTASLSLDALREGLNGYPPAVLLQAAFVAPLTWILAARGTSVEKENSAAETGALARAQTPTDLLRAILAIEAMYGERAPGTLRRLAERARVLLAAEAPQQVVLTPLQAASNPAQAERTDAAEESANDGS